MLGKNSEDDSNVRQQHIIVIFMALKVKIIELNPPSTKCSTAMSSVDVNINR